MTYRMSMVVVLVLASPMAHATGGAPAQGTMLAGQGLDWQRSGTLLQPAREVQPMTASDPIPYPLLATPTGLAPTPQPPPKPSTGKHFFKVNKAALEFSGSCEQVSELVLRCPVSAKSGDPGPDTQFCGHWLGDEPTVWVYLVNGRPDANGGFSFGSVGPAGAFMACSVTEPKNPDPWEWKSLGAIGKCLLWPRPKDASGKEVVGWVPTSTGNQREFNACLRAIRADYCGNGVTHTVDGTHVDLYGIHESHTGTLPYVLEATWNERGAVCLIHARWLSLSPTCRPHFSRILGSPPLKKGKEERPEKGGGSGSIPRPRYTGTEYHCDPARLEVKGTDGTCESEPGFVAKALLSGILADDSLLE